MSFRYQGSLVECIEVYPHEDDQGQVEGFSFALVSMFGRTLMTDRVERRNHQTLRDLMVQTIEMVRHCCHEST